MTMLHAINFACVSWNDFKAECIAKCFKKDDFSIEEIVPQETIDSNILTQTKVLLPGDQTLRDSLEIYNGFAVTGDVSSGNCSKRMQRHR